MIPHFDMPVNFNETIDKIRSEERERCAKICERVGTEIGECPEAYQYCADAIRDGK